MLRTIWQLEPFESQLDSFKSGRQALKQAGPIWNVFISLAWFKTDQVQATSLTHSFSKKKKLTASSILDLDSSANKPKSPNC